MMHQRSIKTIRQDLARMKATDQSYLGIYRNIPIFDMRRLNHLSFSVISRYYPAHTKSFFRPQKEDQIALCHTLIDEELEHFMIHDSRKEYVGKPLFVLTTPSRCGIYQERKHFFLFSA